MSKMVIPSKIRYPFGYTVIVKQLTDKEFGDLQDELPGQVGVYAAWSSTRQTIYLRKNMALKRKIYFFLHEKIHADNDFTHDVLEDLKFF